MAEDLGVNFPEPPDGNRPSWALACLVEERRLALRLTQELLAERADVSLSTIQVMERGTQAAFRAATLKSVAIALDWASDALTNFVATGEEPAAETRRPSREHQPAGPLDEVSQIMRKLEDIAADIYNVGHTVEMLPLLELLHTSELRRRGVASNLAAMSNELHQFADVVAKTVAQLDQIGK